ncbi:hypothetical protein GLOTRDRAFT_30337, partial [Gloeophyllum trabeum ATCC 11539]
MSSGTSKSLSLRRGFSYLQHILIDIWIDQEGFRSVRPVFRLKGYSRATPHPGSRNAMSSSNYASDEIDPRTARADFLPSKREIFTFHHSALDSPPVLRRLTVNGDESRDYIS